MRYVRPGGLYFCILFISSVSFGSYLAEEFVNPSTQVKKVSDFLRDASNSDLVSMGETHQTGTERQVFHDVYQKLFHDLRDKPKCLVEDFSMLMRAQDIVTPLLKTGCQSIASLGGNTPLTTGFTEGLKNSMGHGDKVITHTGFRHILPFGVLFPYDDEPTAVDTALSNTISTQIPAKLALKTKMTVLVAMNLESIYLAVLTGELSQLEGSPQQVVDDGLKALGQKIHNLFSQPNLSYLQNPTQNLFMLSRLQSTSPSRKVYVSLIDQQPIDLNILDKFLTNPGLSGFLQVRPSGKPLIGIMSQVENGVCDARVEPGGILISNLNGYIGVQPDGRPILGVCR